jgi:hypothetical protein
VVGQSASVGGYIRWVACGQPDDRSFWVGATARDGGAGRSDHPVTRCRTENEKRVREYLDKHHHGARDDGQDGIHLSSEN